MTQAFAYLRVSGLGQVEGDSFERQSDAIQKYCEQKQIQIVKVYRDEGVSGTRELENRPALSAMIADLGDVKTLVIEKLDRLARDVITQENIIRYVQNRGIEILSASPAEVGLCDDDPTRKFIRVVLGASAQLEKDLIILRTRVARERIRGRGEKCEGRKSFGDRSGEAQTLETMQSMAANGYTPTLIALQFNRSGVLARGGKLWHPATVSKILKRTSLRK